jgi:hypothetical protein
LFPLFCLLLLANSFPFPFLSRYKSNGLQSLWNLSYLEANRNLINAENGVAKLKNSLANAKDPLFKKAVTGVLFMLSAPFSRPVQTGYALKPFLYDLSIELFSGQIEGHVMLSYNWGCQLTVVRIAQSLKDLGYKVWLDVEQMKGDTLEASIPARTLCRIFMLFSPYNPLFDFYKCQAL